MKTIIILSIAIFSFNQLHASNLVSGDDDEGQVLYKQVCSSCHDEDGINNTPAPVVAGQRQLYVQKQLDDYRLGERPDISMGAMPEVAKSLTKEKIKAVTHYISTLESCDTPVIPGPGSGNIEMGKELVENESCMGCHQHGMGERSPVLNGQKTQYLLDQLMAFRENKRIDYRPMNSMVKNLTDENFADIAAYLNSLKSCDVEKL